MDIDIKKLEAQLNKRIKEIEKGSLRSRIKKTIKNVCLSVIKNKFCVINEQETDLVSGRIVFDIDVDPDQIEIYLDKNDFEVR